jgi:hypothetical protein
MMAVITPGLLVLYGTKLAVKKLTMMRLVACCDLLSRRVQQPKCPILLVRILISFESPYGYVVYAELSYNFVLEKQNESTNRE